MACSKKRRDVAREMAVALPGAEGFVLLEYRGPGMLILESRTTDAIYAFSTDTRRYVDAFDVGMVKESGDFVEVDE